MAARWGFWLCALAVLALALAPPTPQLPTTGWDKSNHALAFGVLALLGRTAYPARTTAVLIGLLAYGGAIELLQALTPERSGDWADLLADAMGLVLGSLATMVRWPWPRTVAKTGEP